MSGGATETPVGCEAAPGGGSKKRDSLGTASSAHLIIKDLGEIHSRLLDHRPVIQGETRYFVKEFECEQLMSQSTNSSRGNRNEKRTLFLPFQHFHLFPESGICLLEERENRTFICSNK
ncbi:biogenesis of lysosome-related organelles complex 1 subunit 5 isoform X6 [Callithrix jacchus]|uniref:biogenesis of lysosome-related organelles complex 1 subunit 5 isoform X7 n=1 Tax=Callithrix jacchus TaxID=9483 RepID=UPI00159CFB88|nr:biogenesis of lysosome-related organelles complex 1 subunit 5 isoform X7 [Callithrix jacchus]